MLVLVSIVSNIVNKKINKKINRRSFILGSLYGGIGLLFSWKFYSLQVAQHEKYLKLSDANRTRIFFEGSNRGKILDQDNIELATSKKFYNIACNPKFIESLEDFEKVLEKLANILEPLELSEEEIKLSKNRFQAAKANKALGKNFFIIKSNLNREQLNLFEVQNASINNAIAKANINLAKLEKNLEDIENSYNRNSNSNNSSINSIDSINTLFITEEVRRFYPFGQKMAHIIGYTKYNQTNHSYEAQLGLELLYDDNLSGKPDLIIQEVDSRGRTIRKLATIEEKTGEDIKISLSWRLHDFIYNLIKDSKAAVTVIEVDTGAIKAIVNTPSYNNNIFYNLSSEVWNNLNNDLNKPLTNRALSLTFQPGSIFKLISALTLLENNIIDLETNDNNSIICSGSILIGGRKFKCWKHYGHGKVSLIDAIVQSCNIYFYSLAAKIKIDDLVEMAFKFSLGKKLFSDLKEEKSGILPDVNWRKQNLQNKWYLGDTINNVIGHGYISVTPLQLAVMCARIATGKAVFPNFGLIPKEGQPPITSTSFVSFKSQELLDIRQENFSIIRQAMMGSINYPLGTSYRYRSHLQKIAGKTGTVQIFNSENINNIKKKYKDHALFIGYAPYEQPKYAISLVLENVGSGGNATKVATQILDYLYI